jgi:hypothetical protein
MEPFEYQMTPEDWVDEYKTGMTLEARGIRKQTEALFGMRDAGIPLEQMASLLGLERTGLGNKVRKLEATRKIHAS